MFHNFRSKFVLLSVFGNHWQISWGVLEGASTGPTSQKFKLFHIKIFCGTNDILGQPLVHLASPQNGYHKSLTEMLMFTLSTTIYSHGKELKIFNLTLIVIFNVRDG